MIARVMRLGGTLALVVGLACPAASAQQAIGVGVDYMGYSLDEGLGADAVQLFMIPVAVRLPLGARFRSTWQPHGRRGRSNVRTPTSRSRE